MIRLFLACLMIASATVASAPAETFSWKTDEAAGTADLLLGDQPVIRYMFAYDTSDDQRVHDTYKVFHHVFGPQSGGQITKGPGGKYTHHRGIFVGWNKTSFDDGKMLDFWHCKNGAHLRHIKFDRQVADDRHGSMTAEIHWNDGDGEPVIREHRTVSVTREATTGGWQIDWQSKLESMRGEITLDGDRQHAGFQFRADQGVAESNGARFLRPAAFPQEATAIQVGDKGNPPAHINLGWFAESYELGGRRYTVEYFDNPRLPKPALFSERPYGRFGTFFKTQLSESQPLELRYRLVVSEGDSPSVEAIQSRYDAFIDDLDR